MKEGRTWYLKLVVRWERVNKLPGMSSDVRRKREKRLPGTCSEVMTYEGKKVI